MIHGLGYRIDLEDRNAIRAGSSYQAIPTNFEAPRKISHRSWRRAKSQGRVGRCTGVSRASGEEVLNYIASGGAVERFSGDYAYIQNQKACGLFGRGDVGATISGSVKAALETGICQYSKFPQPAGYVTQIPAGCEAEGRLHVIRQWKKLESPNDCFAWLASGVGVILIGVEWTTGMAQCGKTMELADLGGDILGGHAEVIHGYDCDLNDGECPYFEKEGSHGEEECDLGFTMVAPSVVKHWISSNGEVVGISDQQVFTYRPIDTWQGMTG